MVTSNMPMCSVGARPMATVVDPSLNQRVSLDHSPSVSSVQAGLGQTQPVMNTTPSSVASRKVTVPPASKVSSPTCTVEPSAYTSGRVPVGSTATLPGGDGSGDGAGSTSCG